MSVDIEEIEEYLEDEDWQIRLRSIDGLLMLKNDFTLESLQTLIKDENDYVRCEAATALGKLRAKLATKAILF